ncbi:MAG: branched-chain amino acid ABC transporter permease [Pseudomonadota bacterium]
MTRDRGEDARLIALAVLAIAALLILPGTLDFSTAYGLISAIPMALLGLSLGLIWGYGGILCFGQTAFFGIGAYAYAVWAVNFGDTTGAVVCAIVLGAAFAAALGYFIFYGRVSDVYLGAITLVVTLVLLQVMRRTSGPEYKIGDALLGGFNGTGAPPMRVPWDTGTMLIGPPLLYVSLGALIVCYFVCVAITRSHFGRVCVAIRENETRAELLGYDARLYKLGLFAIGGGLAALAGVLSGLAVTRVTPELFNLKNAATAIILVIVGGRGTLIGPVIAAFGIFYLQKSLGSQQTVNLDLVLGALLIGFVLLLPQGLVPAVMTLVLRRSGRRRDFKATRRGRRPGRAATRTGRGVDRDLQAAE